MNAYAYSESAIASKRIVDRMVNRICAFMINQNHDCCGSIIMNRFTAVLAVWFAGFVLGFIAYLSYPVLSKAIVALVPFLLGLDSQIVGATIAGMASSLVTLVVVMLWAYKSGTRSYR